jgi:hypothetical protein
MTSLVICGLLLVLVLQTMRSLSGVRLVPAGVLCLGLLWPLAKTIVRGEIIHYAVQKTAEKVVESQEPQEKKEVTEKKEPFGCRVWNRIDGHKKNGLVRDWLRTACTKEDQ